MLEIAHSQETMQTVHICSDGTINPASAPIKRDGDRYFFTGNFFGAVVIEKGNIILDGAGYTLSGAYNGTLDDSWMIGQGPNNYTGVVWVIGVDFSAATRPSNVTIHNLNIRGFNVGVYVWTANNTVQSNAMQGNTVGILLSGDLNNITSNYIADNDDGIFFGITNTNADPLNITLAGNSFVNNAVQFSGCYCDGYNVSEATHFWDDGSRGNFWSDYTGTDGNGDGIGDSSYVIDEKNVDRYPLMTNSVAIPNVNSELNVKVLLLVGLALVFILAAVIIFKHKTNAKNV